MNDRPATTDASPIGLTYEADLCGNIEQALKGLQGYGLMALELIQNADDAAARTLVFDARDDALVVANDATFSSCGLTESRCPWEHSGDPTGAKRPCNFHAIRRLGGRSKAHSADQIGRFGIGFVSVYQVTDTPIIRSVGIELSLNPLTGQALPRLLETNKGTEFVLPWASKPSDIRNALNASLTPPDVAARVVSEIAAILRSSLLFLRHLERVEVRQDGNARMTVNIERTSKGVALAFEPGQKTERWLVLSREADDIIAAHSLLAKYPTLEKLDRSTAVSVAIAVDGNQIDGCLYAYLPTQHKTGMPLHINADFFPHASRQEIVLKGEGHERYWNEALIAAAAAIVGENFEFLKDALKHVRLWQLGSDALKQKENGAFAEFWKRFATAAKSSNSVWTTAKSWHTPAGVYLAPEQMPAGEQDAVASIDLNLLDQSLRSHRTALASVGVGELRLSTVAARLEAMAGVGISDDNKILRLLWAAVGRLIGITRGRPGFDGDIKKLKAASFLLDIDGTAVCPNDVWRLQAKTQSWLIRQYIDDCSIVHPDALSHVEISALIDEYTLDAFAREIAEAIDVQDRAEEIIDTAPGGARGLYTLMTSFLAESGTTSAGKILAQTPFLRTPCGFVTPARGQLPGGFKDPTGYFEFVDESLFPAGMKEFAERVLGVKVLTFHEYIKGHLEEILRRRPSREQYQTLLAQIVQHKNELDDEGVLELLAERAFIRTRDGDFARPDECYFWSAHLDALLGSDGSRWVDDDWMPAAPLRSRLQDLLESKLGMPTTVAASHIVDRITELADAASPDEVAKAVTPIIRHLIEHWLRFSDKDREVLEGIRSIEFVPAVVDGARDQDSLYLPNQVYRANRAPGFSSQVPIIDLTPLRQTGGRVNDVLDFLGVLEEPTTEIVIAHLKRCISANTSPHELTYTILNERIERDDNITAIDDLRDSAFIYDGASKKFLTSDHVFWMPPPFRGYWWQATSRMRQLEPLYRRLGVNDEPRTVDYAALLREIARKPDISESDAHNHTACLSFLCGALERDDPQIAVATKELTDEPTLINMAGVAIWPEDAVWVDAEELVAPFGAALDECLVRQPDATRNSAGRLFRNLGVRPISEIARLLLASEPDRTPAKESTERLQDRADLLLWLAPTAASRKCLRSILSQLEIQLTNSLEVQVVIDKFDPPVQSPASNAPAFFDGITSVLHVQGSSMRKNAWAAAFKTIFSEIERHEPLGDLKALVMTASLIISCEDREEAEETLRSSGYRPLEDLGETVLGAELGDIGDGEDVKPDHDMHYLEEGGENEERGETNTLPADESSQSGSNTQPHPSEGAGGTEGAHSPDRADRREPADSVGDVDAGEYKSKAGIGTFGGSREGGNSRESDGGTGRSDASSGPATEWRGASTTRERKTRTSRMLAYVARTSDRESSDAAQDAAQPEVSEQIDAAAIAAALRYEEIRGWSAQEQPHGNPGYDIVSTGPDGRRRIIEVKGLEADWTPRGIKLSHVQYGMAQRYREEYWIYIVENARDLGQQNVSAIANPFSKVEEYWFDNNWRTASEEVVRSSELNVREGTKVHHDVWGLGTIIGVEQKGIATYVTVDFGFQGKKYIPFGSNLRLLESGKLYSAS
ncbi:MAG: DUF3883 domain-containing protein [Rhizomicrobium sp.]